MSHKSIYTPNDCQRRHCTIVQFVIGNGEYGNREQRQSDFEERLANCKVLYQTTCEKIGVIYELPRWEVLPEDLQQYLTTLADNDVNQDGIENLTCHRIVLYPGIVVIPNVQQQLTLEELEAPRKPTKQYFVIRDDNDHGYRPSGRFRLYPTLDAAASVATELAERHGYSYFVGEATHYVTSRKNVDVIEL